MKISELLGEDDEMKIKAVSGNDVTIDQGGQEIKTTADALVPSPDKPGSFTMKAPDPNQMKPGATVTSVPATSEDVGGDPTDKFIDDVTDHEYGVHEEGQPVDADGPGYSFDSAKGFKDAIAKELGSADPEVNAKLNQVVASEPDGTVDVDQTISNMVDVFDELADQLVEFMKTMIAKFTEISQSVEFQQASPADQQSFLQSLKDMQAQLPEMEKQAAETHALVKQNKPMLQQNIKDRKMNRELKGQPAATPAPATPVAEYAELARWLTIAGLR